MTFEKVIELMQWDKCKPPNGLSIKKKRYFYPWPFYLKIEENEGKAYLVSL